MQDWKIVNSSKYSLSCCTYVFHRCIFVLSFSVLAFSVAPLAMVKNRPHRTGHRGNVNTCREYGSEGVNVTCTRRSVCLCVTQTPAQVCVVPFSDAFVCIGLRIVTECVQNDMEYGYIVIGVVLIHCVVTRGNISGNALSCNSIPISGLHFTNQ